MTEGQSAQKELVPQQTLADLQKHLLKLYSGQSVQLLNQLTCTNCQLLAIEPQNCSNCQETICKTCYSRKGERCARCFYDLEKFPVVPCGKVIERMLHKATFRCPNNCGQDSITYLQLESHLMDDCKNLTVACRDCEAEFHRSEAGNKHSCISWLANLLQEIVGTDIYNQGKTNLQERLAERKSGDFGESKGLLGSVGEEADQVNELEDNTFNLNAHISELPNSFRVGSNLSFGEDTKQEASNNQEPNKRYGDGDPKEFDLNDFSASLDAEINRKLQSTLAKEIKPDQRDESIDLALSANIIDLKIGRTQKVSAKDRLLKLETLMMAQHKINDCLRGLINEQQHRQSLLTSVKSTGNGLRKLPLQGKQKPWSTDKLFEWPDVEFLGDLEYTEAANVQLSVLRYSARGTVSAIQFEMTDGQVQPEPSEDFEFDQVVRVQKLMHDRVLKAVTKIRVKAKDHQYVSGFSFWSRNLKGDDIPIFETEAGEDSHCILI